MAAALDGLAVHLGDAARARLVGVHHGPGGTVAEIRDLVVARLVSGSQRRVASVTVRVDQRTMHDERAAWDPIIGRLIAYVREERTRRRLSLRGAADESGIPFATLARIEHGRAPDLLTFRRLVLWLRIPADRLLGTERRSRAGT